MRAVCTAVGFSQPPELSIVSKVLRLQEESQATSPQANVAHVGEICSPNREAHFLDFTAFPFSTILECFSFSVQLMNVR